VLVRVCGSDGPNPRPVCHAEGRGFESHHPLLRKPRSGGVFCGPALLGERLSWHSLRHSFASLLATDLELPATTLARLTGHADAGFTLKVYARDGRDGAAVVEEVLARAAGAGIGG
jgi:integrase